MAHAAWMTVARQVDRLYGEGSATGCGDDQLLSQFTGAHDESKLAFDAIVRRHGPMVLQVCRCVLGDRHAAEDALQATFLVLARRASSIAVRPGGSLGPWLHGVAFRTAREARRSAGRRQARERRAAEQAGEAVDVANPVGLDDDERRILHEEVRGCRTNILKRSCFAISRARHMSGRRRLYDGLSDGARLSGPCTTCCGAD